MSALLREATQEIRRIRDAIENTVPGNWAIQLTTIGQVHLDTSRRLTRAEIKKVNEMLVALGMPEPRVLARRPIGTEFWASVM